MTQHNDGMTDQRVCGERDRHVAPRNRLFLKGLLRVLLIGVVAGVASPAVNAESRTDEPTTFAGALGDQEILWQNWNEDERQKFWFTNQGSQIIPYDWFLSLEMPKSTDLFKDKKNMDYLRYIPQSVTDMNPDELPIGFTKDLVWYSGKSLKGIKPSLEGLYVTYKDHGDPVYEGISKEWLGLTCAACHTNQIEYNGRKIVIDGAPGMGDLEGLLERLVDSMEATLNDDDKFARFANKVLIQGKTEAELKKDLATIINIRKAWNRRNSGDGLDYGYGRLDAINSILNEISAKALGIPGNRKPANAPVSYPFIWDAPHHDYIQWNGMVGNDAKGALGRNVGEVLGVFGALKIDLNSTKPTGQETSVRIPNLGKLEHLLISLWSPLWPDSVLPRNKEIVQDGKKIYDRKCAGCHETIEPENKRRLITSNAVPVGVTGTDDAMARIFFERMAETGSGSNVDNEKTLAAALLTQAVGGTLASDPIGTRTVVLNTIFSGFRTVDPSGKPTTPSYKARPLNGIWATAPYLHNGSVPTLMQLLKPSQRAEIFYVGSRAFDPVEVGFKYKGSDYGPGDPKFRFNTLLDGNRNTGHKYYGNYFEKNDKEFKALLAYLKTL